MKNHRFPWLRNRTTDNRKCEKACNIKEKRTIEMFKIRLESSSSCTTVFKEIICEQSHAKSSREFILLELFCCDYWRIDDDRAVAKRRGGSCARFADNPYKLTCNPRK